jgi:flagellar hook-associated protein 2
MAGIQLSGLASGLDTASIIDQLMSIEKAPRTKITDKQTAANQKESALKTLSTKLKALGTAASDLSSPISWNPVQTVESSDSAKITASQVSGVGPGSYTLTVTQLASAEQRTFGYVPQAGAGTVTINGHDVPIGDMASIDDVVGAINADTAAGVFAVNVNNKLVLASKTTGNAGAFTASGASLTEDITKHRQALQAQYSVDGVRQLPDSDSNTITSAIPGVSLQLKAVTTGTTVTVGNPGVDKAKIQSKVKAFVDAYNDAMDYMRQQTNEKPKAGSPTLGTLYGDVTVTSAMDALRRNIGQAFTGVGNTSSMQLLSQMGVSTGATTGSGTFSQDAVDGKLTLDTTALSNALDADPSSVQRLLGGAVGVNGFSQSFTAALTPYTQAGGIIDNRVTSTDSELRSLADQLTSFDDRVSQRQTYYQNMFTALEKSLASLQSQGNELAARLGLNSN